MPENAQPQQKPQDKPSYGNYTYWDGVKFHLKPKFIRYLFVVGILQSIAGEANLTAQSFMTPYYLNNFGYPFDLRLAGSSQRIFITIFLFTPSVGKIVGGVLAGLPQL